MKTIGSTFFRFVLAPSIALGLVACVAASSDGSDAAESAVDKAPATVTVQLLAINDFHGNLLPPTGSTGMVAAPIDDPLVGKLGPSGGVVKDEAAGLASLPAGGAAFLAAHVKSLRSGHPNTVMVSAGDLTGGTPLLSNLFADHPVVSVMNAIGLDFNGVGNHEFDRGLDALHKLQAGCPTCEGGPFPAAKFDYLAANVVNDSANTTVFPPYRIRSFGAAKVAFIGMTLEGTPKVSVEKNMVGLTFHDEIATVNALVPEIKKQGASAIVVLVHEGGFQAKGGTYDTCKDLSGDLLPIVKKSDDASRPVLDPAVDVVVSAHTHQPYNCLIDGRLVTSAASFGRVVTQIELELDPKTQSVRKKSARNVVVTRDVTPDPEVASIVAAYETKAAPLANRVVGRIPADIGRTGTNQNPGCESSIGDVIADAQLAATRSPETGGAVVAFMNPGGIRTELAFKASGSEGDGVVTYAESFAVQPFANTLVTQTLTGKNILDLLAQQFAGSKPKVMQVSKGFSYAYTYDPATGKATIPPSSVTIDGVVVDPAKSYRVTANSFLAGGGDDFAAFKEGTNKVTGAVDLDALVDHLKANDPLTPPALNRINGNGCAQ